MGNTANNMATIRAPINAYVNVSDLSNLWTSDSALGKRSHLPQAVESSIWVVPLHRWRTPLRLGVGREMPRIV